MCRSHQHGRPCRYCGEPMHPPTYVCERCNLDKDNRTLIEWLAVLVEHGDHRAHRVAGVVQSLCARGLHHVCGDAASYPQV